MDKSGSVFDVAVIGAGIVGLMVTYRLSGRQMRVCLLEKNGDAGMGVTSGQANVIHVVQLPFGSVKSKLARKGNAMYDSLCSELDVKLLRMPALLVVRGWLRLPVLFFAYVYLLANLRGQFRTQLMRGSSLRKLEPSLAESVTAGVVVHGYGTVDAASLVARLKQALEGRGVVLEFGCEVTGAEVGESSTLLRTSKGDFMARYVVNAAGLHSDDIAKLLGRDLGRLEPGLGVMAVYSGLSLKTIIAPLPVSVGSRTKGGAIIPAVDGTTIFGPTLRVTRSKDDNTFTDEDVKLLTQKFGPLLADAGKLVRVYTGVRPLSPTKDFVIDIDRRRRVVNLVGIESPGLTAAPALAELVEDAVSGATS
ncbi:MAG: FAD-dependent oxidoreductase [Nitrososphaerales archaeon]|nr:FAD-dependent oxidoreductase [Nitrososphaerales archaeon]